MSTEREFERAILSEIMGAIGGLFDYSTVKEGLLQLEHHTRDTDFTFEFDGNEYRIIDGDEIDDIHDREVEETLKDCYAEQLEDLPWFIKEEIDWQRCAETCRMNDGYGHHFASYDGHEHYVIGADMYIFRIG